MVKISLLDLDDDVLYTLFEVASIVHPPHWVFPVLGEHDQQPDLDNEEQGDADWDGLADQWFCLGWIMLSHVCHRLRQICLNSPTSLAKVILSFPSLNPDSMNVPLARARDAYLSLILPPSRYEVNSSNFYQLHFNKVEFAHKLAHRARKFEFAEKWSPDWTSAFDSQTEYKSLTHLVLNQSQSSQLVVNAPNLVALSLTNLMPIFSSTLLFLHTLSLKINFGTKIHAGGRNDVPVCDALRCAPLLEQLSLSLESAFTTNPIFIEHQITQLPAVLERLQIAEISVKCADKTGFTWPSIRAPERVSLNMTVMGECHDKPTLFESVARQMRYPDYDRIVLTMSKDFKLTVETSSAISPSQAARLTLRPRTESMALYPSIGHAFREELELALMATNTDRIQTIDLTVMEPYDVVFSDSALLSFFGAFRATTKLVITTDSQTITPIYDLLTDHATSLLLSLHTFSDCCRGEIGISAYWRAILAFLHARKQAGHRISCLRLVGWRPWREIRKREVVDASDARCLHEAEGYVDEVVDLRS